MIACTKVGALGYANMIPDHHLSQIVDPRVFPDPYVIANRQEPRILDANTGFDYGAFTDPRSKEPEY
jgi:hypothetical protein